MRKHLCRGLISGISLLLFAGLVGTARGQANNADSGRRKLSGTTPSDQVHVDQDCRIYEVAPHTEGKKLHVYRNRGICDVSDMQASSRYETDLSDGKNKSRVVSIREHTFSLHNPTSEPVIFVLEQAIAKGWEIDSDPQPSQIEGNTATFLVHAPPGTTVSVHVGERNPPK